MLVKFLGCDLYTRIPDRAILMKGVLFYRKSIFVFYGSAFLGL